MHRNFEQISEINYYNFEINFNVNNSFYNINKCTKDAIFNFTMNVNNTVKSILKKSIENA